MNNLMVLTAAQPTGGIASLLLWVVASFGIMYFIAIRPNKKKEKNVALMQASIEIGDSVCTTGGFYGVILDVMDDMVIVEFGNNKNCRIPMKKGAIVEVDKANKEA